MLIDNDVIISGNKSREFVGRRKRRCGAVTCLIYTAMYIKPLKTYRLQQNKCIVVRGRLGFIDFFCKKTSHFRYAERAPYADCLLCGFDIDDREKNARAGGILFQVEPT